MGIDITCAGRVAAISYVPKRFEGHTEPLLLVVWNRRYGGWTFPGGLVEPGETIAEGQSRELFEETGLLTISSWPLYDAPTAKVEPHRGQHAYVFHVEEVRGMAIEQERGCPVSYFTRDEFLKACPFRAFYEQMFEAMRHPSAKSRH